MLEVYSQSGRPVGEDGRPGDGVEALQRSYNAERLVGDGEGGGGVKLPQAHHEPWAQRCHRHSHRVAKNVDTGGSGSLPRVYI